MKKLIAYPVLICIAFLALPSCSKNSSGDLGRFDVSRPDQVFSEKVSPGQTLNLVIDHSGTLAIQKQALYSKISKTSSNAETGALLYTYVPADGFLGEDEVILAHTLQSVEFGSQGCNYDGGSKLRNRTSLIAIKIKVAD